MSEIPTPGATDLETIATHVSIDDCFIVDDTFGGLLADLS